MSFHYVYDSRFANNNTVTLKGLSTNATNSMKGPSGTYYDEYQQFLTYYGDTDYADKWITAADTRVNTGFSTRYVRERYHCSLVVVNREIVEFEVFLTLFCTLDFLAVAAIPTSP